MWAGEREEFQKACPAGAGKLGSSGKYALYGRKKWEIFINSLIQKQTVLSANAEPRKVHSTQLCSELSRVKRRSSLSLPLSARTSALKKVLS